MTLALQFFIRLLFRKDVYLLCLLFTSSTVMFAADLLRVEENEISVLQQEIRGRILDENGMPLPGATIMEKGTNNGIQSDFDGNFSLRISNPSAILEISFIGFVTREIPVNDTEFLEITLSPDVNTLNEVVVTALGIKREEKRLGDILE